MHLTHVLIFCCQKNIEMATVEEILDRERTAHEEVRRLQGLISPLQAIRRAERTPEDQAEVTSLGTLLLAAQQQLQGAQNLLHQLRAAAPPGKRKHIHPL